MFLKRYAAFVCSALVGSALLYLGALYVDLPQQVLLAGASLGALWVLARLPRLGGYRLAFLSLAGFLLVRYLSWRTFATLGFDDPFSFIASLLLYGAECYGLSMWFLSAFTNACPIARPKPPVCHSLPSVDVYVPTYDEPEEIVRITLTAAKALDYPAHLIKVYLLDDGATWAKRCALDLAVSRAARERYARMRSLCQELGVHYMTRKDNAYAKAGNLNAAFWRTAGELIAVLDCDHVPAVDFLRQTVPYFADPKVFLVQTPHFFATPDPVEKNLGLFGRMPPENAMFYQAVQLGLDFWRASFFCGSAAVLRRKALEEIGGFSGQTVTEDVETALKLHARGWRSVYLSRPLVAGLQPETFTSLVRQRRRWAQGMVHLLRLANPLRERGLSLSQRLAYFNCFWFWFFPLARVVFLLAPLAHLLLGLKVYDANLAEIGAYTLPYLAALTLTQSYLFGRVRWPLVAEVYESMLAWFSLGAVLAGLRRSKAAKFAVTPKGERLDEDFISPLAAPFYCLLALTVLGFGFGVWRLWRLPAERPLTLVTLAWDLANFLFVTASLGALYERRQRRRHPRLPARMPAELELAGEKMQLVLCDVSVGGAGLSGVLRPLALGARGCLSLMHPVLRRPFKVKVELVDQHLSAKSLGVRFLPASVEEYRALVLLVYGDSKRWQEMLADRQREVGIGRAFLILVACGFRQAAEHLDAALKKSIRRGNRTHVALSDDLPFRAKLSAGRRAVPAPGAAEVHARSD